MRVARIHIRLGTCQLPDRDLGDNEVAHDIIQVEIGDNEEIKEVELVKQGAVYRRRMQTQEEAVQSVELWEDGQTIGRELVSDFESAPHPKGRPRMVNERIKGWHSYRYRLVTLEITETAELGVGEEVVDAQIVNTEHDEERVLGPGDLDAPA
jgi:hypothetical protein